MRKRLHEAMPLIAVTIFLFIGFEYGTWLLGALAFLLIPLSSVLISQRPVDAVRNLVPLAAVVVFLILTLRYDRAHPGWLVFLTIPIANILLGEEKSEQS